MNSDLRLQPLPPLKNPAGKRKIVLAWLSTLAAG